jgi:hypothetical protein
MGSVPAGVLAFLSEAQEMPTIEQKFNDLPRTLDRTYERTFENMNPEYELDLRTILILLAFSTRPMTIQEVAEATVIDLEQQPFSTEDRFPTFTIS